jgi:hypothetical protein
VSSSLGLLQHCGISSINRHGSPIAAIYFISILYLDAGAWKADQAGQIITGVPVLEVSAITNPDAAAAAG